MKFDRTSVTSAITLHLRTKRLLPLSKYLPKHVRKGSTRGRAHHTYRGLLIAVPIRRSLAAQKATGGKLVPPPPDVIDTVTAGTTTVSPLTNQMSTVRGGPSTPPTTPPRTPTTPTTPGGTWPTRPKPKQRLIRKSAGGMQKFWINKLVASDHEKRALKRGTRWYAK